MLLSYHQRLKVSLKWQTLKKYRSQTYWQTNQLAAASGTGTYDLLVGIHVSSLKSGAAEGKYAGVNPNLDQGTC